MAEAETGQVTSHDNSIKDIWLKCCGKTEKKKKSCAELEGSNELSLGKAENKESECKETKGGGDGEKKKAYDS